MRTQRFQEVNTRDMEILARFREDLAHRLGSDRFDLWFGSATRMEVEPTKVTVYAADKFARDCLRRTFRPALDATCNQVLGCSCALEFKVDSSLKAPAEQTSTAATPAPPKQAKPPSPDKQKDSLLGRRRFASLSTFVPGPCNQLAITAAKSMLANPGDVSPLVFYGPPGTGKTHLLEGIWGHLRHNQRTRRVVYLTAEQFTSYFLEALREGGLPGFRHKYRATDVLLLDDVQFFTNKRATLMELQQTLDTMQREGRQVVLAADRRPSEISGLSKELTIRMESGLLCEMHSIDGETRLEVTRRLASQRGIVVPEDCLQMVARRVAGDVRRISGALNRLQAASAAYNEPISSRLADRCLADLWGSTPTAIELEMIERVVSEHCGVPADSLCSKQRTRPIAQSRMLAMFLARKLTRSAYKDIGAYFGNRKHSTVISAQKTVSGWLESGTCLELSHGSYHARDLIERLEAKLKAG